VYHRIRLKYLTKKEIEVSVLASLGETVDEVDRPQDSFYPGEDGKPKNRVDKVDLLHCVPGLPGLDCAAKVEVVSQSPRKAKETVVVEKGRGAVVVPGELPGPIPAQPRETTDRKNVLHGAETTVGRAGGEGGEKGMLSESHRGEKSRLDGEKLCVGPEADLDSPKEVLRLPSPLGKIDVARGRTKNIAPVD
jgi:hypothetical protein